MKILLRILALLALGAGGAGLRAAVVATPESRRSPENQVFQFVQTDTFEYAPGDRAKASVYLWIPENCRRLRGLLVFGRNVTEHTLVGHPAIRAACAAADLGMVWSAPSFFSTRNKEPARTIAFLQHILDGLAATSGYAEVATVPWLPIGESGHLLMVDHLLDGAPQRCIAGIYVKNAHYFCHNRETPILVAVGNAQEWDQEKIDLRRRWNDLSFYRPFLAELAAHPHWPVSLLIDGGSGHFECPEWMARYFARYIAAAARARLQADSDTLRPVAAGDGFVAAPGLPGEKAVAPHPRESTPGEPPWPWYFTRDLAAEANAAAAINWQADTQLAAFLDPAGKPVPMEFRGVTNPVPIATEADGVTFTLRGTLLPALPANFVGAGEPLARAPGDPAPEWICGSVAPLADGRFRIALDRTWPGSPVCVALRHPGNAEIRATVHPGYITLAPNRAGRPQAITFAAPADRPAGTTRIPLVATSDADLPVEFFVVAGPAVVEQGTLVITPIPPRTRFPVTVTVTAWQWGRAVEPRVQTAGSVTRSFRILAPPAP